MKVLFCLTLALTYNCVFAIEFNSLKAFNKKNSPGIAVLVLYKDKVLLKDGFGLANIEKDIAINDNTMFESASVGKIFTAFAVMKLVKEGKIDINQSAKHYLPSELQFLSPKIKVKNLIFHTSGLPDYLNDKSLNLQQSIVQEKFIDNAFVFSYLKNTTPNKQNINKIFEYSNSNYVLLSEIIANVSGMTYKEYMEKEVFEKAEMKSVIHYKGRKFSKNESVSYGQWPEFIIKKSKYYYTSTGDHGIQFSINDLEKWIKYMKANQYYWNLIRENGSVSDKSGTKSIPYGYGFRFLKIRSFDVIMHRGYVEGASNIFVYYPPLDAFIVVLSNTSSTFCDAIAGDILEKLELYDITNELSR